MKYFIDTEFMEDGRTIELLSIGLVCEDGREFYGINPGADKSKANEFVRDAVIPHLYEDVRLPGREVEIYEALPQVLAQRILKFARLPHADDPQFREKKPQFWGYFADYDWVVFCQLFGRMVDLPKGYPMYCMDIKQLCNHLGNPELPKQGKGEHHALLDARWNKLAFEFLAEKSAACLLCGHPKSEHGNLGQLCPFPVPARIIGEYTPSHIIL